MFEAVERARVEALGANRMPGMARNLTARIEDQYAHGRYAQITSTADAPLEDALALMIRERLTGLPPPETAKAIVDLWRPSIEQRGAKCWSGSKASPRTRRASAACMRDLLRALELSEDSVRGRARGECERRRDRDRRRRQEGETRPRRARTAATSSARKASRGRGQPSAGSFRDAERR